MFGVGDFWLEIRVIIKILSHPLMDFHRNEAKKFFEKKRSKMADSKKLSFPKSPILQIFFAKISEIGLWISKA